MMEKTTLGGVDRKIEILIKAVEEMREFLEDSFMTPEEEIAFEKSMEEYRRGETKTLEQIKKELHVRC